MEDFAALRCEISSAVFAFLSELFVTSTYGSSADFLIRNVVLHAESEEVAWSACCSVRNGLCLVPVPVAVESVPEVRQM